MEQRGVAVSNKEEKKFDAIDMVVGTSHNLNSSAFSSPSCN